jgi:hypothetical protein
VPIRPFTAIRLDQAREALAARLHDPGLMFWSAGELDRYLRVALQTWQAHAATWRDRVEAEIPLVQGDTGPWYDLTQVATDLCDRSITDQDLLTQLCDLLLEPGPDWANLPALWTGSEMFTLEDLTTALQRRRDQFLVETTSVVHHRQIPTPGAPNGRVPLPEVILDLRRVAWVDVEGVITPLWREDEWGAYAFHTGWQTTPDTPITYSVLAPPPLQVQLVPVPADRGTLDLLAVERPVALDPAHAPTILDLPTDLAWVVVFGALADLLGQDGPAKDQARAQYAQQRWEQGIALARLTSTVLFVELDGEAVGDLPAVTDLDAYQTTWQSQVGSPTTVAMAGLNLLAITPTPDANGPYSLTLDLVPNMPLPADDVDYLQISADTWDIVLDYAQHLAMFKMGGAEFTGSYPLYMRFVDYAKLANERIRAATLYVDPAARQSQREVQRRPTRDPLPEQPAVLGGGA